MTIKQPTDIIRQAEALISSQFDDRAPQLIKALIGNPADPAVVKITDSDKAGLVFVHGFGADPNSAYTAVASGLNPNQLIYDQPVLLKRDTNGYVITGLDPDNEGTFNAGAEVALDQNPVYINQIFYGNLHPSQTDLTWLVVGGWYGDVWIDDQFTADFSTSPLDTSSNAIDVPTTNNQALIVMVQIDQSAGTLSYKQSVEFNAASSFKQVYKSGLFPTPDSDRALIGYLQLTKGVSVSAYSATQNAPQWINIQNAAYVEKTANYSVTVNDKTIGADSSGGSFTITMPTAVGIDGQEFRVKKLSSGGIVTVDTTDSQTIDGSSTATLTNQYIAIVLISTGADWIIG